MIKFALIFGERQTLKKLLSMTVSAVIFFLCIYYVISYFQWSAISQLLVHVDWKLMPVTVIVTILFFWLFRTMRWFILLKAAGINVNFLYLYLVSSISVTFAIITPLQSGEALKVELLKKTGVLERVPGYGIFITERILDLIIVLLMAMLSIVFGVSKFLDRGMMLSAFGLIVISFLIFFIIVRRISPDNVVGRFFQPFNQCVRNGKTLVAVVFLTIGGWFLIVMGWYASLCSISISINFLQTAAMTAITTLLGIISLIPWSLGISEVSVTSFLFYFNKDIPLAQAGALMVRIYGIVTLILGFVHFLIWKFSNTGKQKPINN
jgi:uncharacterized membrane protein YbhN (UPF0104 family)